eukprot:jgi/Tetstr1/438255/TSEL_026824.t1
METFSIINAGPLFEEARVKAIMTEKELASPAVNVVTEEDGPERKAQVDALTREGRTRYPARRQGAAAGAARRAGQRGAKARRAGQRGAKARRPGQRGANAGGMGGAAVATE